MVADKNSVYTFVVYGSSAIYTSAQEYVVDIFYMAEMRLTIH